MTKDDLTFSTTTTGYTIYLKGRAWIVQDGDNPYFPYDGATMAGKAQAHINAILADYEASKQQKTDLETLTKKAAYLESALAVSQASK